LRVGSRSHRANSKLQFDHIGFQMSVHVSHAIILRTWEFKEADLIVSFFTRDRGRLKGVARGARKSRKRFMNCLDLFSLADLEYELKRGRDLCFLHSGKLVQGFEGIRSDFSSLSLASYMVELTEILFPLGVASRRAFQLLKGSFDELEGDESIEKMRLIFEAKAMALGGYGISLDKCCRCGRAYAGEGRAVFDRSRGAISCLRCKQESALAPVLSPASVKALRMIQAMPWAGAREVGLDPEALMELKGVLKLHIDYRIGRRLKTTAFLE